MKPIIVNDKEKTSDIAEKIVTAVRIDFCAEIYNFGPIALNQSVKAVIFANEKLSGEGIKLAFVPEIESTSRVKAEELIIRLSVIVHSA